MCRPQAKGEEKSSKRLERRKVSFIYPQYVKWTRTRRVNVHLDLIATARAPTTSRWAIFPNHHSFACYQVAWNNLFPTFQLYNEKFLFFFPFLVIDFTATTIKFRNSVKRKLILQFRSKYSFFTYSNGLKLLNTGSPIPLFSTWNAYFSRRLSSSSYSFPLNKIMTIRRSN